VKIDGKANIKMVVIFPATDVIRVLTTLHNIVDFENVLVKSLEMPA